jgi:uridine kinase
LKKFVRKKGLEKRAAAASRSPSEAQRPDLSRKCHVVAIIGGSGSGKTWLAHQLEQALRPNVARLSVDDFYRDRSGLPPGRRARINFDHPRAIDWPTLEVALNNLVRGRTALVPRYDFKTHSRSPSGRRQQPRPIILIEGLWLLHRARLRRLISLSIFLECAARLRLGRRLARDLASRGRDPESIREQFRHKVQPMHQRFVKPQKAKADVVLTGECGVFEIRKLVRELKRLCR